jgi:hypothetical protein
MAVTEIHALALREFGIWGMYYEVYVDWPSCFTSRFFSVFGILYLIREVCVSVTVSQRRLRFPSMPGGT